MAELDLIPEAEGQSPLAAAHLVHAEAQYLAKRIALVAVNDGWNVILDVTPACPPGLEPARAAIDDLEPYVPGSFDDVVLAYDLGRLSDKEYEFLAESAACSVPGRL